MLRDQLAGNGATNAEIGILLNERVELNAMTSDVLIAMIERKLKTYGLKKVVPEDDLLGKDAAALIVVFLAYLYFSTFYELTSDQKLKIKIGFLYRKEIYIRSIKRIRKTKNHMASPALSGDRIEIQFNRYESVLISPKARAEFIDQLRKINPTIKMAEPSKV